MRRAGKPLVPAQSEGWVHCTTGLSSTLIVMVSPLATMYSVNHWFVLGYFIAIVFHLVKAFGSARVLDIRVVHLNFEALQRKTLVLIFGVDVDAAVGARERHHVDLQLEILERVVMEVADIEAVAAGTVRDDGSVLHGEG